ncbi:conserved Plasmodium protein, unknown function [Plasmodium chabaudi chabaudi]|uniref:Uncharacterized protein n=1 Tax=Plasmodium chabaudi chabaudi TaxID=31271 RepID=A0A4V0K3C8_PLACU|nr:conserved Plasmodium protein, unknown function [Plasmodium chabaudi chabaudi]VTZ67367.1 conserved Plasmodium protein, unknown function [Plasmodium chabaudi chabaudi]|eukprot:XP_741237.2 conserved Plasmodium protein, unknown function [Plasmodium chabaudi chabaudi]
MEGKNTNQDKEIIVGKNVIHNNFESTNFMNNFRTLLKNETNEKDSNEYPNYYILNNELGIKESIDNFIFTNNNKGDINKQEKAVKKYIIHLVPSKNSNFYNYIKKKKIEVLNLYGTDETYKYDTHISLTGFFYCDNINTFIKTLYIFFFYYAKLYYIYRKLLLINLFFHIHLKNNNDPNHTFYIINKYKNNTITYEDKTVKNKKDQFAKLKNEKTTHTKCNTYLQNYEITNSALLYKNSIISNNDKTHILKTNDGYVIIPISCDWVKKLIENFQFLLKNNSFKSFNKRKLNTRDDISRTYLFKNEYFYKTSKTTLTKICFQNKNENTINEIENGYNHNRTHRNKSKITILKSENEYNQKSNKIIKKLSQEANIIKYKYSDTNVNLTNFRIKRCNHISLACNRTDNEIKNNIANMYNDIKYHFYNCPWDLVMFECDDDSANQDKNANYFLKEIFRFKNFAVS